MSERLKVLVSAYACSPYKGSEPGVGWGFVHELAKSHDLWVIVEEEKFRSDIERYLQENPDFPKTVNFFFIAKQRNRWLRKLWPPSYYWYYRRWHLEAYALASDLHSIVGFDLAHQLTMVGFREPGYLWKMGIPFVWGPVGGMGVFPWRFLSVVGVYGAIYYIGYNFLNLWQMRFSLRARKAARIAGTGLIAATPENQAAALQLWGCRSRVVCEVGLQPSATVIPRRRRPNDPLRIVWSGQHTPGKALPLGLRALAELRADRWELHVLGRGPQLEAWRAEAHKLGISGACHFHGWLERGEALQIMEQSHVALITSLRDLTSTVTIEALSMGLPVVCLDHCGFSNAVDATCGLKVAVTTPSETVQGLTLALGRLARDEDYRHKLALGAVARAESFSWEKKAGVVQSIYAEVHSAPRSSS